MDITPDKSLIKKLGLAGYRTEQAVAELVDNSIDARVEGGACRISLIWTLAGGRLVTDDCLVMNLSQLQDALTVARETKRDGSLGRFGMGMKGACSSLGKAFAIVASSPGSETELVARYDEDQWMGDGSRDWTNFEIEESAKSGDWHGTKITVSKLRVPLYPNRLSNFKKRFAIRYGPYLRDGRARITINSKDCRPAEPELEEGTRQDIDVRLPSGGRLGRTLEEAVDQGRLRDAPLPEGPAHKGL